MAAVVADDGEVRECIRRLVGVIQSSRTEVGSPADQGHIEHIKKVVRILSLSEQQIGAMRDGERAQVLNIRNNALQKMRLANTVRLSGTPSGTTSSNGSTPCQSPGSCGGFSPASSFGGGGSSPSPIPFASASAPSAAQFQMQAQLQLQAQMHGAAVSGPMAMPRGPHLERHSDGAVPPGFLPHAPDAGGAYHQPPLLSAVPGGFSTDMPPPAFYIRKTASSERNSL